MLKLCNVNKSYPTVKVFENLSMSFPDRQITCILGPSGCGKTTLLKMIAGLESYEGRLEEIPEKISFIFQEDRLLPNLTAKENLRWVCPSISDERIEEILTVLEMRDQKDKYPSELSGGQRQRIAIARAFLYDGDLFLMDEPFSSLDLALKMKLIEYFLKLWKEKRKTVLFVTHDVDEAILLAHQIVLLNSEEKIQLSAEFPRKLEEQNDLRNQLIEKMLNFGKFNA